MRSIFKFVTFNLLGGLYGSGPLDGSSGAEIYQRIHAISPSLLNVQSFSIPLIIMFTKVKPSKYSDNLGY